MKVQQLLLASLSKKIASSQIRYAKDFAFKFIYIKVIVLACNSPS